jgi:hypothetical protein
LDGREGRDRGDREREREMTEELVVREKAKMMDLEFFTTITVEQIKSEPADPEDGRFGYRERHLAEYICEAAGGAVVSVRSTRGAYLERRSARDAAGGARPRPEAP